MRCTPFLLERYIHKHNLPAEGLQVSHHSLGKLWWLNAEVEELPPIVQLTVLEPWRLFEEMPAIYIAGLFDYFVLFSCD